MGKKQTSVFENGLIWFGAGVSIAEILTGTYFASLGPGKGLAAIFIGHAIGCILLFMAGLIGARMRKSAMETTKRSFGEKGGRLFAVLNVLQLAGWTAIMIYDGALAANRGVGAGSWVWCIAIGGLVMIWVAVGITNLGKINIIAMGALFILTLVLCSVVFAGWTGGETVGGGALSMGAAIELSAAMPLSWLPVISDYTRMAQKPVKATAVSVIVYGLVSCWMYVIGMVAALYTGGGDIAAILIKSGLGAAALLILILSTVTTTFLDAFSAGVSFESIVPGIKGKYVGIVVTILAVIAAILYPMDDITEFLYLIGSVFAPMIAVQIADVFLLKKERNRRDFCWTNLGIWVVGFILYRWFMTMDLPIGNTLPDMAAVIAMCVLVEVLFKKKKEEKSRN